MPATGVGGFREARLSSRSFFVAGLVAGERGLVSRSSFPRGFFAVGDGRRDIKGSHAGFAQETGQAAGEVPGGAFRGWACVR